MHIPLFLLFLRGKAFLYLWLISAAEIINKNFLYKARKDGE